MDDPFDFRTLPFDDLFSEGKTDSDIDLDVGSFDVTLDKSPISLNVDSDSIDLGADPFTGFKSETEENRSLLSEFWTGLKRGVDATQAMGYGLTALTGDVLGIDSLRDFGGEGYARNIKEASDNAASVKFMDIAGGDNFLEDTSNFTRWAAGGLGELIPNIATIFAGGGIGGAVARATLPKIGAGAAKKYISKAVEKEIKKGLVKGLSGKAKQEAIEAITDQAYRNLGSTMGAFVAGTGLNTGEIFGNFIDPQTGEVVETADRAPRILATIGGGLLAGALDTVVPAGIFRQANKTRSQLIREALSTVNTSEVAARAAANILLDGTKEGLTESLQELISMTVGVSVDEAREWEGWDKIKPELIESFALGALGGTVMRAPIELTQAKRRIQAPSNIRQGAQSLAARDIKQQLGREWETLDEKQKEELVKDRADSIIQEAANGMPEDETVLKRQIIRTRAIARAQEVSGYEQMSPQEREAIIAEQEARIVAEAEVAQESDAGVDLPTVNPVIMEDATSGLSETGEADEGFDAFSAIRTQATPNDNPDLSVSRRVQDSIEATPLLTEEEATQGLRDTIDPDTDFDAFSSVTQQPTPTQDAIQEPISTEIPVRQQPEVSQGVPAQDQEGGETTQEVQEEVTEENVPSKSRLDLIFDEVERSAEVKLSIDGDISRDQILRIEDAAKSRGLEAAFDGSGFLIRRIALQQTIRSPLASLSQTVNEGHDVVNNVVRAARKAGYDVRVRNPNTQNPDESFRNVGGTFDANQRIINLALSETIDIQSTIATIHETVHAIYNDAPKPIQEALLRWVDKMQNGDFLPFVDPRATDARLRPNNPYDLPEPIFQEELLVEALTLEGVDRTIAQGIIADIIRVLKDLYYRAAMKFMDANGTAIEETAKVWANNRVAAAMAGQTPQLSLRSLFSGFNIPQEDINQSVYDPQGVLNYRIVNGSKVLPPVLSTEAGAHEAQMNARIANLEYQYLFNLTAAQRKGERAQQDELQVVRYRLSELDNEYFDALSSGNEELAQKLVAEAAGIAGYNVGPVYHGSRTSDGNFNVFDGEQHFFSDSREVAELFADQAAYFIESDTGEKLFLSKDNFESMLKIEPYESNEWHEGLDLIEVYEEGEYADAINDAFEYLGINPSDFQSLTIRKSDQAVGEFFLKLENAGRHDFKGSVWGSTEGTIEEKISNGMDGFVAENIIEGGLSADVDFPIATTYVVRNSSQIKSAKTITRDDQGNIIPPSRRFQIDSNDIRFTERGEVEEKSIATKQREYRRMWADTRVHIAVYNELNRVFAPIFEKYPDKSRKEVLQIIGRTGDPSEQIANAIVKFNSVKSVLEENSPIGIDLPDPSSEITYDDLDTEGQRSYFKEMALRESIKMPSEIGKKIGKIRKDLAKAEGTLNAKEEKYNDLVAKINDAKALEQTYRSGLVAEINQLKQDVKNNSKSATNRGSTAQLLADLIDSQSHLPYPEQVDQLLSRLSIDDNTSLFLINRELMSLGLEWDSTPLKELYYQAIEKIKARIAENPNTSLSLLLSGRSFERGDASLRDEDVVSKLRGSALLASMVSFVKKNQLSALALAESTASAEEKAIKAEQIVNIREALTVESLDLIMAEIKAQTKNRTNLNNLIYKLAEIEKEVRKAKQSIPIYQEELGILNETLGRVDKYFQRKAVEIGMGKEFELVPEAEVPAVIDPSLTPEEILKSSNVEKLDLEDMGKPAEDKVALSERLARKGREIMSYINQIESDPDWSEDSMSLAHVRLRDMGMKLSLNAISDDMIRADTSTRNMVRSMADQAGQSGTPAGKRIMQLSRMYDFAMNKLQPFIKDYGAPVGASFVRLKRATGLPFRPLKDMYDSAWAFLELEKVLTGNEAFEAMADSLSENPKYRQALSQPSVRKKFIDFMKQSAQSANFGYKKRKELGLLVEDDKIQVTAWHNIGQKNKPNKVPIYRDALNRGVFMNTRYMRDEMFEFINNFKRANPGAFRSGDKTLWNFISEEQDGEIVTETIDEYRDRISKAFNADPHFIQQVVEPWLLNDRANKFPHPSVKDTFLSLSVMRPAWRESGGDVVRTAEILADQYNVDPVEYIPEFMKTLKSVLKKTDNMAAEKYKKIDEMGVLSGMSRYGADARVDDDVPSVMTEYTLFSEDTNQVLSKQLAAEYAFGRNFDTLEKFAKLMETQISRQAAEYEASVLSNTVNNVVDMKGVKKELGDDFERLKAAFLAKERKQFTANSVIRDFRAVLGNKENTFDIGTLEELHSMIITGMLQGWKTSIKQLSQTYSTVASMRSISMFNVLDPFIDLARTSWAILDMFPKLFGLETFRIGKYEDQYRDIGITDLDQKVSISDGFQQPGFNGEMARDGGSRFKQYARGIRSMISRGTFGYRGGVMPGFTPFPFRSVNSIQLILGTDNILRKMEKVAGILSAYKKANPDVNINKVTGEQLGYKNYLIGPDNAQFLDNFMQLMFKHGMTNEMLVKQYDERWARGLRTLDNDAVIRAKTMTQEIFSVESQLSNRPKIMQEGRLGRMFFALQGWGIQTAMNGIDTSRGRDMMGLLQKDPKKVMQASIAGNKAIVFHLLPAALIFSLFFDWYDEELAGKKSDIRPLVGNKDPKDTIMSIMERLSVTGPLGILGDITNELSNIGTGKPAVSIDERVIFVSSLIQLQRQLSTIISTEAYKNLDNITYNQNVRPLMQAFGAGSILSNVQVVSNLLGMDNAESRTATRINTNNALRAAGRATGLEVRTFGAGFSRAVPYTPHVTNMILAAMSNNREQFRDSYEKAITAMQSFKKVSRGEAKARVNKSYSQRHPIRSVFRTSPTQKEYKQLLSVMSPSLRESVIESISNYNRLGSTIGVKPYYGKSNSDAKKTLDNSSNDLSVEELLNESIFNQFNL